MVYDSLGNCSIESDLFDELNLLIQKPFRGFPKAAMVSSFVVINIVPWNR